jgi:two-component system, NarL family, invasion response regulator UvrY
VFDLGLHHSASRHKVHGVKKGGGLAVLGIPLPPPGEWLVGRASTGDTEVAAGPGTAVVIGVSSPALLCGLEVIVRSIPGVYVGGATSQLDALLDHCARAVQCVALVDPFIGGGDVRSFMQSLKGAAPRASAVFITDAHRSQLVREAVKAGARGFVAKSDERAEICDALSAVAGGGRYFAPVIAADLAESILFDDLTRREMEVLERLVKGCCNKAIARDLDVAVGTVKTHVCAIMAKLDARSRTEAVLSACRLGLIRLT